ncbi:hypothetical protein MGAS10270_Spy0349 [Streptococcus pyogenes MGAS10270]|nr:hypothetical protein MGAS10270_Spy0349 [Streptococcus pyogenes MGAS10270]
MSKLYDLTATRKLSCPYHMHRISALDLSRQASISSCLSLFWFQSPLVCCYARLFLSIRTSKKRTWSPFLG